MMRIDQDTFKNDKLNFGMNGSAQRNSVSQYRRDRFKELFVKDYPELYIKLQCDGSTFSKYMGSFINYISFKHKHKLVEGLSYNGLETLDTNEFNSIMKKFGRFLLKHQTREEELRKVFQLKP